MSTPGSPQELGLSRECLGLRKLSLKGSTAESLWRPGFLNCATQVGERDCGDSQGEASSCKVKAAGSTASCWPQRLPSLESYSWSKRGSFAPVPEAIPVQEESFRKFVVTMEKCS